jgi:hypothetical protein
MPSRQTFAAAGVCVLSFRTRQVQIDACVEDVTAEAAALSGGRL